MPDIDFDFYADNPEDDDGQRLDEEVEKEIDQFIERGVKLAAKGENVDYLLEVMGVVLPPAARRRLRNRFAAELGKRALRQPSRDPDRPARTKLRRLFRGFMRLAQLQAAQRVLELAKRRPDVAQEVTKRGRVIAEKGGKMDSGRVSSSDLTNIVPVATTAKPKKERPEKKSR